MNRTVELVLFSPRLGYTIEIYTLSCLPSVKDSTNTRHFLLNNILLPKLYMHTNTPLAFRGYINGTWGRLPVRRVWNGDVLEILTLACISCFGKLSRVYPSMQNLLNMGHACLPSIYSGEPVDSPPFSLQLWRSVAGRGILVPRLRLVYRFRF